MRTSILTTIAVIVLLAGICKPGASQEDQRVYLSVCQDTEFCVKYATGLGDGHCCDVTNWEKRGNWGLCKPTSMAGKCLSAEEESKLPRTPYKCLTTEECHKGRKGSYPPAPLTCCDMEAVKYKGETEGECVHFNSTIDCEEKCELISAVSLIPIHHSLSCKKI